MKQPQNGRGAPANPDLDTARLALARCLPELIGSALENYRGIAEMGTDPDPKAIAAHQGACKAALGHMEMLLKLARLAGPDSTGEFPREPADAAELLREARAALGHESQGET